MIANLDINSGLRSFLRFWIEFFITFSTADFDLDSSLIICNLLFFVIFLLQLRFLVSTWPTVVYSAFCHQWVILHSVF